MSLQSRNKAGKKRGIFKGPYFSLCLYTLFFLSLIFWKIFLIANTRVELGNERFIEVLPSDLNGKSLGLVINHTSLLPDGKSLLHALLEKGQNIQAVFTPEHGYAGNIEAGFEVEDGQHKNIPIFSLYGKTRRPTPEMVKGINAFIYDIQDIGTRFYTYITTLKYVLEAAAEASIPVYVLDRPNPAGGIIIEGPLLQLKYQSFIAALPIPVRYGLTLGELAMMMKGQGWVPEDVDLHIIKMKNWKRRFFWKDTGLPWIPTSPNIPTPETAIIYSGSGLLGALNLNEGRGTPRPFLQFGSPWLKPRAIIQSLKKGTEFGVELEAITYTPRSLPQIALHPLYENKSCRGIRVHITRKEKFYSVRFALALLKTLKDHHSAQLSCSSSYLNQMFGNDLLSQFIEGKVCYNELLAKMEEDEKGFKRKCRKYFLYK